MNIDILLAGFDASQIEQAKSLPWLVIGLLAFSAAVGVYNFLQMRKMQKKNRPKPNQLDGTIADEGISFYDLAGSPHVHANITDIWDKSTKTIKKKSGGFLGIGSTSQVTGYRYYAKFAAFIGNRIEKLLAINFDNRKWVIHDPEKHPPNLLPVLENNLFGENEGGVSGQIDIHFGYPDQEPNSEYQKYFPLVSGYPYQSYLVFRGLTATNPLTGEQTTAPGFYLGNSGYMKEMLLWVKRIHVKNNGDMQWYNLKAAIGTENSESESVGVGGYFEIKVKGSYKAMINGSAAGGSHDFDDILPIHTINHKYQKPIGGGSTSTSKDDEKVYEYSIQADISFDASDKLLDIEIQEQRFGMITDISIAGYSIESVKLISESKDEPPYRIWRVRMFAGSSTVKIIAKGVKPLESNPLNYTVSAGLDLNIKAMESNYFLRWLDGIDINPIHKIREILTDDTAMGNPESDVNDADFTKAADRIYNEGLGISWAIDEKSCIEAIEELCYHIEAGIRVNRQTGLYEMVLFRDDWFEDNEIHDITENKIKDLTLEVMNSDDIVNQLNVTYYDRERIKNSTFSIYENGSILTMGHANAESVEFPYFMNMRNAEIVANWKLKQFSTPAWSGSFTTGWKDARKWNRYDLIRLPWSKKWEGTILARIMKINLGNGTNNTVTIDFEEVIPYSGEMNTSVVADESMEEKPLPPQPAVAEVFESPYYFNVLQLGERQVSDELVTHPDFGIIFATALRPQWNSMNAKVLSIAVNRPDDGWLDEGYLEYSSGGIFLEPVARIQKFIPVGNLQIEYELKPGQLIFVGQWLTGSQEFMIFKSYDANTGIIEVERGALDTIPLWWDRVNFFIIDTPFVGDFYYTSMDKVRASVLPTTPSGILEHLGSSSVEMNSRAIRPYPPANVKINGNYWPETHIITNDIVLTWVDRNRLQQAEILGFFDAGVTVESGVTYSYELICENEVLDSASGISANTVTILASILIPNKVHTLKLWSVRDGYESYQKFEHAFFGESVSLILTASTDGFGVVGNTVPTANISVNIDESLSANMQFDGSSISGKAEPGATITIEIEE